MARALETASGWLDAGALGLARAALLVMLAAVLFQVVARYLFAQPPFWTEELARYAMIWAGTLGATCAFRRFADPRVVEPRAFRSHRLARLAVVAGVVPVAAFAGPLVWFGIFGDGLDPARGHLGRSARRLSEALGMPMVFIALALTVMGAIVLIHAAAQAASALSGGLPGPPPEEQETGS